MSLFFGNYEMYLLFGRAYIYTDRYVPGQCSCLFENVLLYSRLIPRLNSDAFLLLALSKAKSVNFKGVISFPWHETSFFANLLFFVQMQCTDCIIVYTHTHTDSWIFILSRARRNYTTQSLPHPSTRVSKSSPSVLKPIASAATQPVRSSVPVSESCSCSRAPLVRDN